MNVRVFAALLLAPALLGLQPSTSATPAIHLGMFPAQACPTAICAQLRHLLCHGLLGQHCDVHLHVLCAGCVPYGTTVLDYSLASGRGLRIAAPVAASGGDTLAHELQGCHDPSAHAWPQLSPPSPVTAPLSGPPLRPPLRLQLLELCGAHASKVWTVMCSTSLINESCLLPEDGGH
jgi:hypothetical protein